MESLTMQQQRPFLVLGHRGCMGEGKPAENTIPAFEYAFNHGADGIEIDVHLSQDRWLVVIHDKTVNRTTNKTGSVSKKKLYNLQQHDTGNGVTIPSLKEALDCVEEYMQRNKRDYIVNIELKGQGTVIPVCEVLEKYIALPYWSHKNIIVSSFDFSMLKEVYAYDTRIPIGVLLKPKIEYQLQSLIEEIGFVPYSIHPVSYRVTDMMIAEAKKRNIKILCWGVENIPKRYAHKQHTVEQLVEMGIDGIITNNPEHF